MLVSRSVFVFVCYLARPKRPRVLRNDSSLDADGFVAKKIRIRSTVRRKTETNDYNTGAILTLPIPSFLFRMIVDGLH